MMLKTHVHIAFILLLSICLACSTSDKSMIIQDVSESHSPAPNSIWLSHEHILVDFIGAKYIQRNSWNHDTIIEEILPFLEEIKACNVKYFVDATPAYLGRDVLLLEKLAKKTGINIITNTGLYGAYNNKYIPDFAIKSSAEDLSEIWIKEFQFGIDNTTIKPGFIKIAVDNSDPLSAFHQKLVEAAARTHLKTGLTIASHTGKSAGLWPQLQIITSMGVSPEAFIWIHAHMEENNEVYLEAYKKGCWISLDGLTWNLESHIEKILYAKANGILDKILISHDAGWYDPQKEVQTIKPYTRIFKELYPALKKRGFTEQEFNTLISDNPSRAFSIRVKEIH